MAAAHYLRDVRDWECKNGRLTRNAVIKPHGSIMQEKAV